jgi:hypothetical protein
MIIELITTEDQRQRASTLYEFKNLKGSITKGEGQGVGALGEVVVHDFFKGKGRRVSFKSTYDYDLIIDDHRVDVKTKKVTSVPQPHYNNSISAFNTRQECDFYFFVRVHENMSNAYLLGYMDKKTFFEKAEFNREGEIDKSSPFGWRFKGDCYNMRTDELHKFKQ